MTPGRYEAPPVEDAGMWDVWLSMFHLPAMAVADELLLFSALAAQPQGAPALAERLGLEARATSALLHMLAALELAVLEEGAFALTARARTYLLPESPYYWGPLLKTLGVSRQLHTAMLRALRTRAPVAGSADAPAQAWQQGAIDPATAASVSRVMHCHSLPAAIALADGGALRGVRRLLDVGAGSGCFSIALLQRDPTLSCTIMELAAVCEVARGYAEAGGVSDRVETRAVDMFREPWPEGHDAVFLSNVFHDWDRTRNSQLAASAFAALPAGGRIFLHEMLLADEERSPPATAAFSLLMLLTTPGRQYGLGELREILEGAGFTRVEARPSYGRYSIVSAEKR